MTVEDVPEPATVESPTAEDVTVEDIPEPATVEDVTADDVTVEDIAQPATASPSSESPTTLESPDGDDVLKKVMKTMAGLQGPEREAVLMEIAKRVKVTIVGEEYALKDLIKAATAAKAAPTVHAVIADECIRLGIGRQEYRRVVVPMYNKIRNSIV